MRFTAFSTVILAGGLAMLGFGIVACDFTVYGIFTHTDNGVLVDAGLYEATNAYFVAGAVLIVIGAILVACAFYAASERPKPL